MAKRAKAEAADEVETLALDPRELAIRCHEFCPPPMDCALPSGWPPEPNTIQPGITSLAPSTAVHGTGADFKLKVTGTDFKPYSVIYFAGHEEPTTLEPDGTLSTMVKPSLWGSAAVVQTQIRSGSQYSNAVNFTFT